MNAVASSSSQYSIYRPPFIKNSVNRIGDFIINVSEIVPKKTSFNILLEEEIKFINSTGDEYKFDLHKNTSKEINKTKEEIWKIFFPDEDLIEPYEGAVDESQGILARLLPDDVELDIDEEIRKIRVHE